MYKGYKIIEGKSFYNIIDKSGRFCRTLTKGYFEKHTEKEIIDEMIRHRTPKPPKINVETEIEGDELKTIVYFYCPDCDSNLGKASDEYKLHHCANCGQMIEWEASI